MRIFNITRLGNGFAISHLRITHIGFYLEFTLQTINDNIKVQLAHTGNNGLTTVRIGGYFERRIFHSQTAQSQAHLFNIGLGLRLNCQLNNRLREHHVFQNNRMCFITKRITCCGVFQTGQSDNIAGISLFDIITLVGVHQKHTTDTFFLVFNRVINV